MNEIQQSVEINCSQAEVSMMKIASNLKQIKDTIKAHFEGTMPASSLHQSMHIRRYMHEVRGVLSTKESWTTEQVLTIMTEAAQSMFSDLNPDPKP